MAEGDRGSEEGVLPLLMSSRPLLLCLPLQTCALSSDASQLSRNLLHGKASVREEGNDFARAQRLGGVYAYVGSHPDVMQRKNKNKSERLREASDHWKPLTLLTMRREASQPQVGTRHCGRLTTRIYIYMEAGLCRRPYCVYKGSPTKREAR